ncbi:MAG: hypothetical protein H7641_05425 [Candidatus Heimdallarchaeota archaeon]|nr:hypothetical protein [Candidatus Heimdallarchaeota archaeon]MCK4877002.1 hypothetical protein [Candidatus Heimdallarchaeota archaeon]
MSKLSYNKIYFVLFLILILFLNLELISSDAQTEMFINKISTVGGMGYDIEIYDNYAYITSNGGVEIINIQDPYNPEKITTLELSNGAFGVFIKDDLAFIAAGSSGLVIADISDPTDPTILGQSSGHGISRRVYATDDYAFIACCEDGLKIFNISNLANPIEVGEYLHTGRIDDVILIDNIAILANPFLGLEVVNVTLTSSPQRIRTFTSASGATGLSTSDNLLFVGCYSSNVWVLNITIPDNPNMLGVHTDTDEGEAQGVVGNSTHVYVADNFGVEFLDISNLPQITEVAEYRQGIGAAHDVDFKDNFVLIAGGSSTTCLQIFEIATEQKSRALGIYVGLPIAIVVASVSSWIIFRSKRKKA